MKTRQIKKNIKRDNLLRFLLLNAFSGEIIEEDLFIGDDNILMCGFQYFNGYFFAESEMTAKDMLYQKMYEYDIKSIKECRKLAKAGVKLR